MRVLVVDNYDSFVSNLVQYLGQLGVEVDVVRNDPALDNTSGHAGVLLSPGPGRPERAGRSVELVHRSARREHPAARGLPRAPGDQRRPGHVRQDEPGHPRRAPGCSPGLPQPFTATHYHSLTVAPETVPAELVATAHTTGLADVGVVERPATVAVARVVSMSSPSAGGVEVEGDRDGTILVGGIDEAVETFGGVGGYRKQSDVINGDQVSSQYPGDGLGDGVLGAVVAQRDREALQGEPRHPPTSSVTSGRRRP